MLLFSFQYIPNSITPHGRQWMENEKITLRSENGEWQVKIVLSNGLPRISAGWNKFAKDNELIYEQSLTFILVEEEENGAIFEIELH